MTHRYNLPAMHFDAARTREWLETDLIPVEDGIPFDFEHTPEGYVFWGIRACLGLDEPARAALHAMLAQHEREAAVGIIERGEPASYAGRRDGSFTRFHLRNGSTLKGDGLEVGGAVPEWTGQLICGADVTEAGPSVTAVRIVATDMPDPLPGTPAYHATVESDWLPHHGGACPVAPETVVEVRLRYCGRETTAKDFARNLTWDRSPEALWITAFRIVSPPPEPDPIAATKP